MRAAAVILASCAENKSASDVLYSYVFFGAKKCYGNCLRQVKFCRFMIFLPKFPQNEEGRGRAEKVFTFIYLLLRVVFGIIISHDRNICSGHIRGKRGISIDMRGSGTGEQAGSRKRINTFFSRIFSSQGKSDGGNL